MLKLLPLFLIILVTIVPIQAFADTNSKPSFGWSIKVFIDDFHESIVFDPVKKAQLQAQHASEAQKEVEKLANLGQPIPQEVLVRVDEKIKESEITILKAQSEPSTEENNIIKDLTGDLVSAIKQASEANQIREAISEYHQLKDDLKAGRIDAVTATDRGIALQTKANNLEIVRQYCNGENPINAMSLATESDGYAKLQEKCPELKKFNLEEIMQKLDSIR